MEYAAYQLTDTETKLLDLAKRAAEDSPDRSRKVGAVLLNAQGEILSAACNTLPAGVEHSDEYLSRPAKYDWTEHAERNAIFQAAREGKATDGCTMVLPWFPCGPCARAIVQSGVKRVIAQYPDVDDPSWGADFKFGLALFKKAGIDFQAYVADEPAPQARAEGDIAPRVEDRGRPSVRELVAEWNAAPPSPAGPVVPGRKARP